MRYRAGAPSYLDLLEAQRSLFSVELWLAQVQGQQALDAVTLYKSLGGERPGRSWDGDWCRLSQIACSSGR